MTETYKIFVGGDVMIGRGVDQILSFPSSPQLYEPVVSDARQYIDLAESKNGPISRSVSADYIWGDALSIWQRQAPNLKIINLETAITTSQDRWTNKLIHYRMHPKNIEVLQFAQIDLCCLANNHLLDWGEKGLLETIQTLQLANIKYCGAGENLRSAMAPAIIPLSSACRVLVFSIGLEDSGIPKEWSALEQYPGVNLYLDLSPATLDSLTTTINDYRSNGDIIIISIHWGSNWGYEIPKSYRQFAYDLIDHANVNLIYGHSSHHPRPIEIYRQVPIFYGCGDFINDYEGIHGYEHYRGDLSLMYFLQFDKKSHQAKCLEMFPMQIKKFKLQNANQKDSEWLYLTLRNQSSPLGTSISMNQGGSIIIQI